jgi:hypothetical protein
MIATTDFCYNHCNIPFSICITDRYTSLYILLVTFIKYGWATIPQDSEAYIHRVTFKYYDTNNNKYTSYIFQFQYQTTEKQLSVTLDGKLKETIKLDYEGNRIQEEKKTILGYFTYPENNSDDFIDSTVMQYYTEMMNDSILDGEAFVEYFAAFKNNKDNKDTMTAMIQKTQRDIIGGQANCMRCGAPKLDTTCVCVSFESNVNPIFKKRLKEEKTGCFISVICPTGVHRLFDEHGKIKVCTICEYHLFENIDMNIYNVSKSNKIEKIENIKEINGNKNNIYLSFTRCNHEKMIDILNKNLICFTCLKGDKKWNTSYKIHPSEIVGAEKEDIETINIFATLRKVICRNCFSRII